MSSTSNHSFAPWRAGAALLLLAILAPAATCDEEDAGAPKVDLPHVGELAAATETPPRLTIHLLPNGDLVFKGNRWPLATGRPDEQVKALVALRDELRKVTSKPEWREADGSSKVSVLIHGDRKARWQYVQWIMQICAEPTIAIYKIQFAVRRGEEGKVGTLATELPKDRGIDAVRPAIAQTPHITVKLFRRGTDDEDPANDFTRIRVGHETTFELPKEGALGTAEAITERERAYAAVMAELTAKIRTLWTRMGSNPNTKGEIKTPRPFGLKVLHGDVMRVLECFYKAGIADVRFEGTPAPIPVRK